MFESVNLDSVSEIPISQSKPTRYNIKTNNNLNMSILARIIPEQSFLLVLFNGAIAGQYKNAPKFSRWSWAEKAGYSFIAIDDPVVSQIGETNLAWYIGTESFDVQDSVSEIIASITSQLDISHSDVVFYGSSGGGFASLMAAIRLRGSGCIVSNPQTNILKYHKTSVDKYINSAFRNDTNSTHEKYLERFSAIEKINNVKYLPTVYYKQNITDKNHFKKHYLPFQEKYTELMSIAESYPNRLFIELFSDIDGHSAISNQEQFEREINFIANHITSNKNENYSLEKGFTDNLELGNKINWLKTLEPIAKKILISGTLLKVNKPKPALLALQIQDDNYNNVEEIGFKYSKGLKCAFKYIYLETNDCTFHIEIPKNKNIIISKIGIMKWNHEQEIIAKDLKIEIRNED